MTKIKICGLCRPCDINFVNLAEPDYGGFVINFPKSRRNVTPEQAGELTRRLASAILPVGVFVDQPVEKVADLLNSGIIAVAQLHGNEDEAYLAALRALTGGKPIWKAFRVRADFSVAAVNASSADLVLLDNGRGTGQRFDWSLLSGITRPFFLAGGLEPGNLAGAIRQVHPYGVDLSSGVESGGYKNNKKIQAAVAAVKQEEKV